MARQEKKESEKARGEPVPERETLDAGRGRDRALAAGRAAGLALFSPGEWDITYARHMR